MRTRARRRCAQGPPEPLWVPIHQTGDTAAGARPTCGRLQSMASAAAGAASTEHLLLDLSNACDAWEALHAPSAPLSAYQQAAAAPAAPRDGPRSPEDVVATAVGILSTLTTRAVVSDEEALAAAVDRFRVHFVFKEVLQAFSGVTYVRQCVGHSWWQP